MPLEEHAAALCCGNNCCGNSFFGKALNDRAWGGNSEHAGCE